MSRCDQIATNVSFCSTQLGIQKPQGKALAGVTVKTPDGVCIVCPWASRVLPCTQFHSRNNAQQPELVVTVTTEYIPLRLSKQYKYDLAAGREKKSWEMWKASMCGVLYLNLDLTPHDTLSRC